MYGCYDTIMVLKWTWRIYIKKTSVIITVLKIVSLCGSNKIIEGIYKNKNLVIDSINLDSIVNQKDRLLKTLT